jgi:AraC-like DNA-binding protein
MIFVDLIAAISRKLSAGEDGSASRPRAEKVLLDPSVRVASIDVTQSGDVSACHIDGADALRNARVMGIIGFNPVAETVATYARAGLGIDIVHCGSAAAHAVMSRDGAHVAPLASAMDVANVFCLPLPLTAEAAGWLRAYRTDAHRAQSLIIAWRRSAVVERALLYLSRHFADEVKLPALACHVGVSKFHLVRQFRTTLGITPHRCQLLLRLSQARTMLRQGTGVAEVALALGFFDQSHLDRTFRLLAGMAPSLYRTAHANFFQDKAARLA